MEAPESEDGSLLERVKLTRDSKRALVRALTAREMGAEKTGKRFSKRGRVVLTAAVLLPGDGGGGAFAAHTRGTVRVNPAYSVFDHTYAPDPDANGWFENAVEEICAPYLGKIRPAEGTDEAQPPRTGPDSSARPTAQVPGLSG